MRLAIALLVALFVALPGTSSAEQSWELSGDFVALKPGDPQIVVLRLRNGRTIEVPLESLSEASRIMARDEASTTPPSSGENDRKGVDAAAVTVKGPFERSVRVFVPEAIKDVEADAIRCRSATEAVDVYRLFLAGERHAPDQRSAAQARLKEWQEMGAKGLVRFGERWVPQAEAKAAAEDATKAVDHALVLMRLGNLKLATTELQRASRIDPEHGRANFVLGLGAALYDKNAVQAAEHFAEVVRRDPENSPALNNLAVLEMRLARYALAAEHFRRAVEWASDPRAVADSITVTVKLAGGVGVTWAGLDSAPFKTPSKMPSKIVEEFNALYRTTIRERDVKPVEGVAEYRFLGPDGGVCTTGNAADIAKMFEANAGSVGGLRRALGFVVAPGHVVCTRSLLVAADGKRLPVDVYLELPSDRGRRLPATVVAAPEGIDAALLKCEGLGLDPLPLARKMPSAATLTAVDRDRDAWLDGRLVAAGGKALTSALASEKRDVVLHTAVVPRGYGGGPIVDASGHVIGMIAPTPRTESSGNFGGFSVPVESIWPMIHDYFPDLEAADDVAPENDVAEANKALSSTVIVSVASVNAAGTP